MHAGPLKAGVAAGAGLEALQQPHEAAQPFLTATFVSTDRASTSTTSPKRWVRRGLLVREVLRNAAVGVDASRGLVLRRVRRARRTPCACLPYPERRRRSNLGGSCRNRAVATGNSDDNARFC